MVKQGLLGFWTIVRLHRLLMKICSALAVINNGAFQTAQMVFDHHSHISFVVLNQQVVTLVHQWQAERISRTSCDLALVSMQRRACYQQLWTVAIARLNNKSLAQLF